MKDRFSFLWSFLAIFSLVFSGCSESDVDEFSDPPVISAKGITVTATAGKGTILYSVTNPIDGQSLSVTSDVDWIHDITTDAENILFEVDDNPGAERTAKLTLSYPQAKDLTVEVAQTAGTISLSTKALVFNYKGGTMSVTVTSGGEWVLTGGDEWVVPSKKEGVSGDEVEFKVAAVNETDEPLETTFTFVCGKGTAELDVTQNQEGHLLVEQVVYNIAFDAKEVEVKIKSDIDDVTVALPENCDWLKSATRAEMVEKTFRFTVTENTTDAPREAVLVFSNPDAKEQITIVQACETPSNILDIMTDPLFRNFAEENFDADKDGVLTADEAGAVTEIELNGYDNTALVELESLTGIEYFTKLKSLRLYGITRIMEADLSKNVALESLYIGNCSYLKTLKIEECTALKSLSLVSLSKLKRVDVTGMPDLEVLSCYGMELLAVDVTQNPKLKELQVGGTYTSIDLSKNPELESATVGGSNLASIDVSHNPLLKVLSVKGSKLMDKIDVTVLPKLEDLDVSYTAIADLDLSKNLNLLLLSIEGCNNIKVLDVHHNLKLNKINAYGENLSILPKWQELIMAEGQEIADVSGWNDNVKKTIVGMELPDDCLTLVTDENLKQYILDNYDSNKDGVIDSDEAMLVTAIDIPNAEYEVASLDGMNFFVKVEKINIPNNKLTSADVSPFTALTELNLPGNQITTIDFTRTNKLQKVDLSNNQLINVESLAGHELVDVNLSNNKLTSVNISYTSTLERLDVSHNELTELSNHYCEALKYLNCSHNNLTAFDIWAQVNLETIDCSYNPALIGTNTNNGGLYQLDYLTKLKSLNVSGTAVEMLDLTGNLELTTLIAQEMPNPVSVKVINDIPTMDIGSNVTIRKVPADTYLPLDADSVPDETLRGILKQYDTNDNDDLSLTEVEAIKSLKLENLTIKDMTGLEKLTALETLEINNVLEFTRINFTNAKGLREFRMNYDADKKLSLEWLSCVYLPELEVLVINADNNVLSSVDINGTNNLILEKESFCLPSNLPRLTVDYDLIKRYEDYFHNTLGHTATEVGSYE